MSELYNSIKTGMQLQYLDFWHSGILSWKTGVVDVVNYGTGIVKFIRFDNRDTRVIFPHRMDNVRELPPKSQDNSKQDNTNN